MRRVAPVILCAVVWTLNVADGFSAVATTAKAVAPPSSPSTATQQGGIDGAGTVLTTVAVTGATGRTGRLVVQELLRRGTPKVLAIVRNETKAAEAFGVGFAKADGSLLEVVSCDLTNEGAIQDALRDADATIWCATGFSDTQPPTLPSSSRHNSTTSLWRKVKSLMGFAGEKYDEPLEAEAAPKRFIDMIGLPVVAKCMLEKLSETLNDAPKGAPLICTTPRVVMLSSAGVTRLTWDDKKKELFPGAADIPIVRLNPFGILDVKRTSEEALRESGVPYCIVRPAGLNDNWPAGSRPILTQGDVAVGRINRQDVAEILVDALTTPEATDKTFEAISVAGYPKSSTLSQALSRLAPDKDGAPSFDSVYATYVAMQQLLPGEKQDSAALAMGQTYEQLDRGILGRLGKRGEENAEAAAPKPSY